VTVTSPTGQKAASTQASYQGKFNFAAARKSILSGSTSLWGTATTVTLLGNAAQKKGTATYNAQAFLKEAGVNLTDEQKQKLANSDRATAQLERAGKAMQGDRKASAADKIKQIKERLQQLMMSGGDPKQIARQAAQLARELKEAVREYGAASGGGGAAEGADAPNVSALEAKGEATAAGEGPETASAVEAGAAPGGTQTTAAKAGNTEAADTLAEEGSAGEAETPEDRHKALMDLVGKRAAEAEATKAEREFINEIKNLAKQIKALFERKKNEAEKEKGSDLDLAQDGKAVGESMREIEDALGDLEKNLPPLGSDPGAGASGLLVDPALTSAPMGSVVSVLA
jgi:hypothetical protein